ncbi:MAG: penicillin-binding protein 2 [Deltaproteobacteria bacterium]|nr:penicillin-binding protein 2 [Deltaproteobacteria bacterium]
MRRSEVRDHDPSAYRREKRYTIVLIIVAFSIIFLRLVFLQIIQGNEFLEKSLTNAVRERSLLAVRGIILDVHSRPIAINRPAYNLVYFPVAGTDKEKTWQIFKDIFAPEQPPFSLEDLTQEGRGNEPVRLVKNISRLHIGRIEAMSNELPGVSIEVAPTRVYQYGEAMAHIVGYLGEISREEMSGDNYYGYRMGSIVGKKGIEKYRDLILKGRDGAEQIEVNVKGKGTRILGTVPPVAGHNVVLNIDADLQAEIYEAFRYRRGVAIVMDVNNGAIIAMVNSPSFDPNKFITGISEKEWKKLLSSSGNPLNNRAVAGLYPPASLYKPFIATAALEEKIVETNTSVYCRGSLEIGDNVFRCWKKEGHGRVDLHRAIVESCDVYFYSLAKSLTVDAIAKYAQRYGFGSLTGVDIEGERKGIVPTREWKFTRFRRSWVVGDTVSVTIGQGYNTVTPLQLAVAYAAIANGGTLWMPQIVKKITSLSGDIITEFPPKKMGETGISNETMAAIRMGLWGVVNDLGGTGALAKMSTVEVCGKTGTAQVVSMPRGEKKARYIVEDHALFAAYAPCQNPEIVAVVIMENAGHGGAVAAPLVRNIIESYIERKKVQLQ